MRKKKPHINNESTIETGTNEREGILCKQQVSGDNKKRRKKNTKQHPTFTEDHYRQHLQYHQ
jgi:hypothetical protein